MGRHNDHTTCNLLDYEYFSKHYILTAIDLNKNIELENPDLNNKLILFVDLMQILQQHFSSLKNQKKQLLSFHKML